MGDEVAAGQTQPMEATALGRALQQNPDLLNMMNVMLAEGTPSVERMTAAMVKAGINPDQVDAAVAKATAAVKATKAAARPAKVPGATKVIEEAQAAEPVPEPLPLALTKALRRLRRAVRDTFPDDSYLMICVGHRGIQLAPLRPIGDKGELEVLGELAGEYTPKRIGWAIEDIVYEIGVLAGSIPEPDPDDDGDDDDDDGDADEGESENDDDGDNE
jgi:hypothetical protein